MRKKIIFSTGILVVLAALSAAVWLWINFLSNPFGTVQPYVQPGTNAVAVGGVDSSRLVWVTETEAADFTVDFGPSPSYGRTALPEHRELAAGGRAHKYTATLTDLKLDSQVYYRVRQGGKTIRANAFAARKSATNSIHFVAVGDTVRRQPPERRIAWGISQQRPDFLLHLGDIVYFKGKVREYRDRFWPCYNDSARSSPRLGAPIMGSVPFHVVLGNHDVHYGLNLAELPDGLAAFYFFHAPANGPRGLKCSIPVTGGTEQMAAFRAGAGDSFPGLSFYSFENGPAHFLFLDANTYTDFEEPSLRDWIERDLRSAGTPWKFVVTHQPAFQTAVKEYNFQHMRLLSPLLERCGVDVVFSGHTHNYQRTKPIKFLPQRSNAGAALGWVNGRFDVDNDFDGTTNQLPRGIIHVVSGGGGARLFDLHLNGDPVLVGMDTNNWVPFTARLFSGTFSFSDVTVTPKRFTLRQIDDQGREIDRLEIRKP